MGNTLVGSLEQIYTPESLTNRVLDVMLTKINMEHITEILEPCAGDGGMTKVIKERLKWIPIIQFDICPKNKDITQADFLKLKIKHKKGRICITNPPFTKGTKFINKSLECCDYFVGIVSSTTFMNIDYEKYELVDMYFGNEEFCDGKKYIISVIILKNKKNEK